MIEAIIITSAAGGAIISGLLLILFDGLRERKEIARLNNLIKNLEDIEDCQESLVSVLEEIEGRCERLLSVLNEAERRAKSGRIIDM